MDLVLEMEVERKNDDLALQKKNVVAKSKDVKTGCNMEKSFEEDCDIKLAVFLTMIMETCFSETLVIFQRTPRHYIPEDRALRNHGCEILKSY
jgi:hypothetical protein